MQVRCQNCKAQLSVPAGELREVKCPRCGVLMMLRRPDAPEPEPPGAFRRSQTALKRVYEPIPRPVVYLAGAGLALLLTSPFWIYVLKEKWSRSPVIFTDDGHDIVLPPATNLAPPVAPLLDDRDSGTLSFDRFRGVRLDAGREDLQRRFNLRLQNTRGMVPEIYGTDRVGDIEQMLAYFYGNALKEFSFLMRERRKTPDEVQQELVEQFGDPQQVLESANTARGLGVGLPGLTGGAVDFTQKFPKRRDLTWADRQNRVNATIYYNPADPGPPSSLLSLRISAAAWLQANHPLVNPNAPAVTNALDRPVLLTPSQPARSFP